MENCVFFKSPNLFEPETSDTFSNSILILNNLQILVYKEAPFLRVQLKYKKS